MTVEQISLKVTDISVLLAKVESRSKSNETRLNAHDEVLKENATLITAIKELAVETKYMREDLNNTVSRLDKLETKDSAKWEKFMWLLFSTAVGLVLGYVAFKLGLK